MIPPSFPFNTQSVRVPATPAHLSFLRKKIPASHRARVGTSTVSLAQGANREVKERVKGKASRVQSTRIGSALVCVRRNVQHRELKLCVCVCVCVFSSHSFWTSSSLDVPAGVTQEEGHTGFLIHLLSAVRALIFLARRIQPFLSLVDREVEFCLLTI